MSKFSYLLLALGLLFTSVSFAQKKERPVPAQTFEKAPVATESSTMEELPFREIPAAPAEYTACSVAARTIDGLGFRYYWATEGLTQVDLNYKFSESSRTVLETLEHLYNLSDFVLKTVKAKPIVRGSDGPEIDYNFLRSETLKKLYEASSLLRTKEGIKIDSMQIIFERNGKTSEFPVWHLLNGPLADALWHVGQVVSSRRASGNPLDPNVNVFMGKNRS